MMGVRSAAPFVVMCASSLSCLGAVSSVRNYYVLGGEPAMVEREPLIAKTVHVRNMDAEAVYEKFQIVVRRSPYDLRYSEANVWAVKPNQMVSDIIAKTLIDRRTFRSVTRNLHDARPDYTLSGEIHAIEIYDSGDQWFAHLAIGFWLNEFDTGNRVMSFSFDERKLVESQTFSHAVRALSELLATATAQSIARIEERLAGEHAPSSASDANPPTGTEIPSEREPPEPVYVPEPKRTE